MEIGTSVTFSAAHRLTFHKGKCKNLHGHNWKVEVQINGPLRDNMVVDFGEVKSTIRDLLDHKTLVFEGDDILIQRTEGFSRLVVPFETTAENLAQYIQQTLRAKFFIEDPTAVIGVTVFESEESFASEI